MPAKGQKRKQQIIDAAKRMFIEYGFQSTHIGQVCDELDIARGTVYQYFGNKKEILYAILEYVEEEFDDIFDVDDLEEFLSSKPDSKMMKEFLVYRISTCIKAIVAEPIVIMLLLKQIAGIDEEVVQKVVEFVEYVTKILVRDFDVLKDRGVYKSDIDSRITAIMLIGGVILLVNKYQDDMKKLLDKEIISQIAENFLHGVSGLS
jgi:AcrR family transcriptional regulator